MRAFEVYLNGQMLCVAGVKDGESLSAIVCHAPGGAFLDVSGSTGPQADFSKWVDLMSLNLGDMVTIKVVDTNGIDVPLVVHRGNLKKIAR